MKVARRAAWCSLVFCAMMAIAPAQNRIPSPQEVFGFPMGADRKLVDWNQIVSYLSMVDQRSDRLTVEQIGTTTLGKPFLLAVVASESSMRDLAKYRAIQRSLALPYSVDSAAAAQLAVEGKTVVLITLNIHSTEIAASQESVELIHELVTSDDDTIREILNEVIVLIIPSLNPDGQQLVTEWYRKTLGSPAEGTAPPELYHHYAGHDNNRDWYMYNLAESRHTARVLYHDWYPEIVMDQHQMGSNGPRLFLPPYADPVNPNVDPLISAGVNLLGNYMVAGLHQQGFRGVVTGTTFNAFFEGTMSKTPLWHNRIGILSEAASARIASPLYFPKGSLQGMGAGLPENKQQTNFLDPWEGGWWRLRDIIEYEKAATYRLLTYAARFKREVKTNFYTLNRKAISRGSLEAPRAYVLPVDQHDISATLTLVERLLFAGVQVEQLTAPTAAGGRLLPAGSYVISLAQPARAYVKDLFERQKYPDLLEYPDGPPQRPYDITGWTMPMAMGVEVIQCDSALAAETAPVVEVVLGGRVPKLQSGYYLIERRHGASYGLVNGLLRKKIPVFEVTETRGAVERGTFAVAAVDADAGLMQNFARSWRLPILENAAIGGLPLRKIRAARVGVYQPWVTSMDEGWTRLVLDSLGFAYQRLHNEDLQKKDAKLRNQFDVIILPSMSTSMIVEGRRRAEEARYSDDEDQVLGTPERPKQYRGGIDTQGVDALRTFVGEGGTLLAFGEASNFAIEKLRVPAVNVLKGISSREFYAPGSLLAVELDRDHPLAAGMQEEAVVHFENSPTFRPLPYTREVSVVASYRDENPLRSGWLKGEERLRNRAAMLEIPVGKGRVVLYGFGVQHRAQTHGSFKLFLNALIVPQ